MIKLTNPVSINSVLGGTGVSVYDKLDVTPFTMDPVNQMITGTLRLTSSANASQPPILGTLEISTTSVSVQIPQINFFCNLGLTAQQGQLIPQYIETAQAEIENGLVALGLAAGARSAGV